MLAIIAPLLVGGVLGWMIFYFVRKYDRFTPKTLLGTLTALIGGDVIAFLLTMKDQFSDPMFHLWYFTGLGTSFFIYAIYILIVTILFNRGKIKDDSMYGKFTATPVEQDIQHLQRIETSVDEFEYLLACWYKKEMSDEVFTEALKHLSLTLDDYHFCCSYGRFDPESLAAFREKGFECYLRKG